MTESRIISVLTATMLLTACAGEQAPPDADDGVDPGWQGTIEERNGVVNVDNPVAPLWEDTAGAPLVFEPDGVFGGPDSGITGIGGAVVDREGNLHVYDPLAGALIKLDDNGAVLHRTGDSASGDRELSDVRGMAYDGADAVWLVNQNGTRLDAWNLDGTHQQTIEVGDLGLGSAYMGGFLSPGRLVLLTEGPGHMAANEYVVIDLDGQPPSVADRFTVSAQPMVPIPPGVVLQLSHHFEDGHILVGTWEQYVLREYDADGSLLRRVTRPVDYLRRPGFALVDGQYLGVALGGLAAPIVLDSGHWLVLASWPTNVDDPNGFAETPIAQRPTIAWDSSLDLFDVEGRFLYSLSYPGVPSPDIGRPWTVGPQGRLYTVVADPFPQVRRYRVVLRSPAE